MGFSNRHQPFPQRVTFLGAGVLNGFRALWVRPDVLRFNAFGRGGTGVARSAGRVSVVHISSVMSVMLISSIGSVARTSSALDTTVRTGKPSAWSQSMTTAPAARSAVTQSRGGVAEYPASSAGSSCSVSVVVPG